MKYVLCLWTLDGMLMRITTSAIARTSEPAIMRQFSGDQLCSKHDNSPVASRYTSSATFSRRIASERYRIPWRASDGKKDDSSLPPTFCEESVWQTSGLFAVVAGL